MSDTLVFYICEYDVDTDTSDMQAFVMYDFKTDAYLLYGHRRSTSNKKKRELYKPFYFRANKLSDITLFITTLLYDENRFTYALYAMNELPINPDEINFESLYDRIQTTRELVALDDQTLNICTIENYIRLTRKMYSIYECEYGYCDYDSSSDNDM
jgi:hypothetical protein